MNEALRLVQRNLYEVFGERNRVLRRERIAELWTADCRFVDPDGEYHGAAELDSMIEKLLAGAPDFVFSEIGPQQAHHDIAKLGWGFGPEGKPPAVSGTDVALLRDGKIAVMYTFLDPAR